MAAPVPATGAADLEVAEDSMLKALLVTAVLEARTCTNHLDGYNQMDPLLGRGRFPMCDDAFEDKKGQ